jgi:hypothetical protein
VPDGRAGSAELTAWLERSRATQNLPRKVTDKGVLIEVAAMLMAAAHQRGEGGDARPAP